MADNVNDILKRRGETYGEAWLVTGQIARLLDLSRIERAGYLYAWLTILCKLIRILSTPDHADSWLDIQGYAQLVHIHITAPSGTPVGQENGNAQNK